ncbi:MAG TPA: type II toxin-antitoxin system VapC family toxin [Longimicrobium sp.]|jgi:hypothetical protein|uniref:type II toxin-antitoxin system VapC family toxin n=1 Tax=Longimicrobium sp. TaxID=2029185 RepID=UPI002EDBA44C
MDKPTLYIETSIVSYLASRPSRDPVTARNQQLTHAWWNTRRQDYALCTSALTRLESGRGEPGLAWQRLALLANLTTIQAPSQAADLARMLHQSIPLPKHAEADAEHIALAAASGMVYLLTWDSKHIANPHLGRRIAAILERWGYAAPVFCTPAELMR